MHHYIILWCLICGCSNLLPLVRSENDVKLHGLVVENLEIELDLFGGDALITYNDAWTSKAKVAYAQKKKMVAYKDVENELCLLENIAKQKQLRTVKYYGKEERYVKLYQIARTIAGKYKTERLVGKKLAAFCGNSSVILLSESLKQDDYETPSADGLQRTKRELHHESKLSHQEISKKLLEDLANAESLLASKVHDGKGIKRNIHGTAENGGGQFPSSSAKLGQPAGVDYHASIRNNLPPGATSMHPIDITSSVTITTGSSHPSWSYPSSHYGSSTTHQNGTGHPVTGSGMPQGVPHHSMLLPSGHHYNTSQSSMSGSPLHGGHSSYPLTTQPHHQDESPHSSSPRQDYSPPFNAGKSHHGAAHYPPSSSSKPQGLFHYPPSSSSKAHNVGHYPPSSSSKPLFPPYSSSKPRQGLGHYAPSATTSQHSPSHYPPSSSSKTYQNTSSDGIAGHHPSHPSVGPHYIPSSSGAHSSQRHQHSYLPPSSTSKIHHSPSPVNGSHGSHSYHERAPQTQGRHDAGYAPQFPPSSTSKLYHPQGQYGAEGKTVVGHYPPSSTSKLHHFASGGRQGGSPQAPSYAIPQYPPSSTSKTHSTVGHHSGGQHTYYGGSLPSQTSPSSTSRLYYSSGGGLGEQTYGLAPVPGRSSGKENSHVIPNYPPSSTSKVHYSPQGSDISMGLAHHSLPNFPPSSTSKTHYSPSSGGHDMASIGHPHGVYPPSSTAKVHYSPVTQTSGPTPVQIPQPPTDRTGQYPPSSTSTIHAAAHSHHSQQHHYAPSASSSLPFGSAHSQSHTQRQHVQQTPGSYPPSSTSKLHQAPAFHQNSQPAHISASASVSITPGNIAHYPPSSSSKNAFVHRGGHPSQSQTVQQPYHSTPSHHSHNGSSMEHASQASFPPSSSGPGSYSLQYPPSSSSKIHPVLHHNGSTSPRHGADTKTFYPMAQHPSSPGQHYPPVHHNGSSDYFPVPGRTDPRPAGAYYPPSGHHSHPQQYPPSSSSALHPQGENQQRYPPSSHGSHIPTQPCQSPRSLYSITTRTILTPNGVIQRPVSVKSNGESPCVGAVNPAPVSYNGRYSPCSATLTRNGQIVRPQIPCTSNGNLRKSLRSVAPGPAVIPARPQQYQYFPNSNEEIRGKSEHHRGFSDGVVVTNTDESQTELLHGLGYPISQLKPQFSRLEAAEKENSTSEEQKEAMEEAPESESLEENGKTGKDVEDFEGDETTEQQPTDRDPQEENIEEKTTVPEKPGVVEEEVKEGDVLEPGDRILGKDGYTISDGLRGRVISVTGQVGKTRGEVGKGEESGKKSNFGQFKYSSALGRYVKDNGEKKYSNCQGEPTFTCTEFFGSNGRAKICRPNPRRNPDGSPC